MRLLKIKEAMLMDEDIPSPIEDEDWDDEDEEGW